MGKKKNIIWDFFASTKLALFTFFILAATSVIGTIVPQNGPPQDYVQFLSKVFRAFNVSDSVAQKSIPTVMEIFRMLGIPDMYNSWWFVSLLGIFSINLIVCSLERLPNVWRMVTLDNLAIDLARLAKMPFSRTLSSKLSGAEAASRVAEVMAGAGWRPAQAEVAGGTLLFCQKGAWSRLGVYGVHTSILVIFIGAIIGSVLGLKGSVYVPEHQATKVIYQTGTSDIIPLGFEVRCDRFEISYYGNGAPKEYLSDLVVIDGGREVLRKSIEVNDPLHYKGFTFYQSSYQGYDEFFVTITNQATGQNKTMRLAPGKQAVWPEAGVKLGIVNYQPPNQWGEYRLKIWFSDGKGAPSQFWLDSWNSAAVQRLDGTYQLSSKQFFATGLQVAKDPGVWYVYIGCTMMLLGLVVALFLSHKRIWVYIAEQEGRTSILVAGQSNKNKIDFEKNFDSLTENIQNSETFQSGGETS